MLHLLRDPEVMRFVLNYVLDTPGGRRSVARISRTCKALSEMALDVLWRELDSILPLLYLMPGHLFKKTRRPGQGFDRSPRESDWTRVLAHGERVRKIAYNESAGNVHPTIFRMIAETKTRDYVLPNLKSLHWRVETTEGLMRSLLFLTPHLRDLVLEIGSGISQDHLAEFLTEIASKTRLSTLSITSTIRLPHYLPRLMQQQTTLEKVTLLAPGALLPSIGRWLSSMSSLRRLHLDVGDRTDGAIASFFSGPSPSGSASPEDISPTFLTTSLSEAESTILVDFAIEQGFKQLLHLSLTGEVSAAVNFLTRVKAPLQHIELVLDEPNDNSQWPLLWSTLSRQFWNSLRSIVLSSPGALKSTDLTRSTMRGEMTSRHLRLDGLSFLPRLTRFEADLPESRLVHDQDLQHLALACPNIEIIKVSSFSKWPLTLGPPKTTLLGLTLLTAGCKRLHTLSIPLSAFRIDNLELFEIETSSRSLARLHVGHSWVKDPLHVAILLSHIAPYLDNLRFFHEKNRPGYVEAHCAGWQTISEILPQLQQLRLLERSRSSVALMRNAAVFEPPSDPSYIRLSGMSNLKKTVSRAIQAAPTMADVGSQTKLNVRHKNISTKPVSSDMVDEAVDARPYVRDQCIMHRRPEKDQGVDVRPARNDKNIETLAIPLKTMSSVSTSPIKEVFEELEISEPVSPSVGYIGRSMGYMTDVLRTLSPPFLLQLFDLWAFTRGTSYRTPTGSTHSPPL